MQVEVLGLPVNYEEVEPVFEKREGWRRIYPDLPGMGRTPTADWIKAEDEMLAYPPASGDARRRCWSAGPPFGGGCDVTAPGAVDRRRLLGVGRPSGLADA